MARPRSSGERPPTPLAWTAERGAPGNPIPRLGELRRTPSPRSSQNSCYAKFVTEPALLKTNFRENIFSKNLTPVEHLKIGH